MKITGMIIQINEKRGVNSDGSEWILDEGIVKR